MSDTVWVVSQTDVPRVRYAWGKRTHAHTYYKVFDTHEEAFAFVKDIRDKTDARNAEQAAKYKANGWSRYIPSMPTRYNVGQKPRALWPADDGSRVKGGWLSMDKVQARRVREAKKRAADARARMEAARG